MFWKFVYHIRGNFPAYIVALLGIMAVHIGKQWLDGLEKRINEAICASNGILMSEYLSRIKAMVIETPTEYITHSHPAIKLAKRVAVDSNDLSGKCGRFKNIGIESEQLKNILILYSDKNYEEVIRISSRIKDKNYLIYHLYGSSLNRLSIKYKNEKRAELQELSRIQMVHALDLAGLDYNGLRTHLVIQKMKCNSIILNSNIDINKKIQCFRTLLDMQNNPILLYNLAKFTAIRGVDGDYKEAVSLFSRFASMAPSNICRHDIMADQLWRAIRDRDDLGEEMSAALAKLRC